MPTISISITYILRSDQRKGIKTRGSFVTRKVYTLYSYKITRFVPTDACHQGCIRNNNIRLPGEMCEESLYDNYAEANQGLVERIIH